MKLKANIQSSIEEANNKLSPKKTQEILQTYMLRNDINLEALKETETTTQKSKKEFLNKKRKISDLNFETEMRTKCSNRTSPLVTTETKITNYFNQKKSSSFKKSYGTMDKLNEGFDELSGSFCKKLDFEKFEVTGNKNNDRRNSLVKSNNSDLTAAVSSDAIALPPTITERSLNVIKKVIKGSETKATNSKNKRHSIDINTLHLSPKKLIYVDTLIDQYSMKDKYEGLIKRELILPCHFQMLLSKFTKLDEAIQTLRKNGHKRSLTNIQAYLKDNYKIKFILEEFQQILFITPHFFIYKWEKIDNNFDLVIEIPNDIARRVDGCYDENTDFMKLQTYPFIPMEQEMNNDLLIKRLNTFKKILLVMTNEEHKKFLSENNIVSKINPFKHRTWNSQFEVHNIPKIQKFNIMLKPKTF
jgi:hypothetical protein